MAAEEPKTFDDIFVNKLKSIDANTLERTIAKAVGDLIGVELKCSVDNLQYQRDAFSFTSAQFDVSLSEPIDFGIPTQQEEGSSTNARTCDLCAGGFRRVKTSTYPNGALRKCTHNPEIESQIPTYDLNS